MPRSQPQCLAESWAQIVESVRSWCSPEFGRLGLQVRQLSTERQLFSRTTARARETGSIPPGFLNSRELTKPITRWPRSAKH